MLNTDYKNIINQLNYKRLIVTWPIDEYFDYKYGQLDYKKTDYKFETIDTHLFQEVVQVNYPNDYEFTRITEIKHIYSHLPSYSLNKTTICKEYPWIWKIDAYPVETETNIEVYKKYKLDAEKLSNVYFLGRLANYKYQDMDVTYKNALDFCSKIQWI
jgi:UDP-galactopyranose mutase